MPENMMNGNHKATNRTYRTEYDRIFKKKAYDFYDRFDGVIYHKHPEEVKQDDIKRKLNKMGEGLKPKDQH